MCNENLICFLVYYIIPSENPPKFDSSSPPQTETKPKEVVIASGSIRGNFWGQKKDFAYAVPDGAINVRIETEDLSPNSLNLGSGNGKATLSWDKSARTAHVHAWVNGAIGRGNHIIWTIYARLRP